MDIRTTNHRHPVERRVRPLAARPATRLLTTPPAKAPGATARGVTTARVQLAGLSHPDAAPPSPPGRAKPPHTNGRILARSFSAMPLPAEKTALPLSNNPPRVSAPALPPDNTALVAALVRGEPAAWNELVDRFGPDVERLVAGALGVDADLSDIVQDVFVRVMERIHQLRDPAALKSWIASVAVFAARGHIRRRRRWRWIRFLAPADIPDVPATTASPENHALVHSTYKLLDTLPENERLAFSLRFIAEMELTEVAAACGVSLATIKRRLSRAELRFVEGARVDPALNERIERGERWRSG